MKIFVQAKPRARKEFIEKISETHFVVAVCEPPEKGRANEAIIKALAQYFSVARSRIRITSGASSRNKIVEIK
ncbi:MAG: DUF167 domain-containing protein [Candidatus Portnoybacteria bacterium]|nr:DUF167 domain-containing protein [Candidatus Portnoybacteria bacterium]